MQQRFRIDESTDVNRYLENNADKINVGDTIEMVSNNQMANVVYRVIMDDSGKKIPNEISSYEKTLATAEAALKAEEEKKQEKGGKKRKTRNNKKRKKSKKSKKSKKTRKH